MTPCKHIENVPGATPSTTEGCEECLAEGRDDWVELRVCQTCGHVGCCESSPREHAAKHHEETDHPIITPLEDPEAWTWCYVHEAYA